MLKIMVFQGFGSNKKKKNSYFRNVTKMPQLHESDQLNFLLVN